MKTNNITLDSLLKEAFFDNNNWDIWKSLREMTDNYNSMVNWYPKYFGVCRKKGKNTDKSPSKEEKLKVQLEEKKEILKKFGLAESSEILTLKEKTILSKKDIFCSYTIQGISSFPRDKHTLTQRVEHFLNFLNKKYNLNLDLSELENYKYRDRNERLLKILKYLHSGKKTRDEIADTFGISLNMLNEDLRLLQSHDEYEFLGFKMKMSDLERSENTYKSKVNPLFYAANMSEIYSLTVGLKLLSKGTVFEHSLSPIADKIYTQLSDYAKEVIDIQSEINNISFEGQKMRFLDTSAFLKQKNLAFTYFLKEAIECEIVYRCSDELKTIVGTMELSNSPSERFRRVVIKNSDDEIGININDILRVDFKKKDE